MHTVLQWSVTAEEKDKLQTKITIIPYVMVIVENCVYKFSSYQVTGTVAYLTPKQACPMGEKKYRSIICTRNAMAQLDEGNQNILHLTKILK